MNKRLILSEVINLYVINKINNDYNNTQYEFICDTEEDLEKIQEDISYGNLAFVISDKKIRIYNGSEWVVL